LRLAACFEAGEVVEEIADVDAAVELAGGGAVVGE
jgi:hypothetical protein